MARVATLAIPLLVSIPMGTWHPCTSAGILKTTWSRPAQHGDSPVVMAGAVVSPTWIVMAPPTLPAEGAYASLEAMAPSPVPQSDGIVAGMERVDDGVG